jgi:hypothetical protein
VVDAVQDVQKKGKGSKMAIPGFTAEAALHPTSNLYRIVGPGVPEPAKEVTTSAQQNLIAAYDPGYTCARLPS